LYPRARLEHGDELGPRQRRAVVVALVFAAAFGAQELELLGSLDAFGGDLHAQAARHGEHRTRDRHVVLVMRQVAHEAVVELDGVHGEALEVAKRGVAGAEIVHREAHAAAAQHRHQLGGRGRLLHHHALGHLELEQRRIEPGLAQRLIHVLEELPIGELSRR
jgi:hypothetical protein